MGRRALGGLIGLLALWPVAGSAEPEGAISGVVQIEPAPPEPATVLIYVPDFKQPPPTDHPVLHQKEKRFEPELLPIVAGQTVDFSNDDENTIHNVFSTSPARPFDLGKYPGTKVKSVAFPKPGIVDVYCDIHEAMSATVVVLPNHAFALVKPGEPFRIEGIPSGQHTVYAYLRFGQTQKATVKVEPGREASVSFRLAPSARPMGHPDKYGKDYARHTKGY